MNVCFNVNRLGLEGLGATIISMIVNCSNPNKLKLWFFEDGLSEVDKENIRSLLSLVDYTEPINFIYFDAKKEFGHLKDLHGDWTTYGRLLIADYIQDEAIYLDSDLIINCDVLDFEKLFPISNPIAAVYGPEIKWTNDSAFLHHVLGLPLKSWYFNAGVLVFNCKLWRDMEVKSKCMSIGHRFRQELPSGDQTILNAYCRGAFTVLPEKYNLQCLAYSKQPLPDHGIIHFVGSPKPWDFLGKFMHDGYKLWRKYELPFWSKSYHNFSMEKVRRFWFIRNSFLRVLQNRSLPDNLFGHLLKKIGHLFSTKLG